MLLQWQLSVVLLVHADVPSFRITRVHAYEFKPISCHEQSGYSTASWLQFERSASPTDKIFSSISPTMSLLARIHPTVIIFLLILLFWTRAVPHSSTRRQRLSPYHNLASVDEPSKRAAKRLFKSFIGDDGRVYACSMKNFYAFESNGSIAWVVYLKFECNSDIVPVHGVSTQIFLVAENRVLKLNLLKLRASEPAVQVFFSSTQGEGLGEIIGISASISSLCVLITVKNRGLFSYTLNGKLMWSAGPVLFQHGYRQGCRKNITECYFTSAPVIDHCEASIYILNNVGELYSLSLHGPYFKWIQDLSSFGNILKITPGNNGLLYVTAPDTALIVGLNVSTGNILWQGSIGPLSSANYEPVVDANGWISFGSLDGFLYSFSSSGELKRFPRSPSLDSVIQVNPVLDCSGYALYISETKMEGKNSQTIAEYSFVSALKPKNAVFTLLVPASGSIYWSESDSSKFLLKLSQSDLQHFVLDERTLLAFFAASRTGNSLPCRSSHQKLASSCSMKPGSADIYTGNERTIISFLLIESVMLVLLAAVVRYCCIFWKKRKLQGQNLGKFLEKRRSLRAQQKALDQTITELEKTASEEATAHVVLEKLSDLVRDREDIRRKLSTTYSLGRDTVESQPNSLLPLHEGKTGSYTFEGSKKGSVSIFQTISNSNSTSSEEYSSSIGASLSKGKALVEVESSRSSGKINVEEGSSASGGLVSHLFSEIEEVKSENGDEKEMMGNGSKRSLRRRTMSMPFTK